MLDEKDLQAIAQLMNAMEERIDKKFEQQKEEILSETRSLMVQQKEEILEDATHRMKVLLDAEVNPKFALLAEGQQSILDSLPPKSELEQLRSEVDLLKMAFRTMSRDIAELKKAQ